MTTRPVAARTRPRSRLLVVAAASAALTLTVVAGSAATATAGGDRHRIISAGPLADYLPATAGPFDDAWARVSIDRHWRSSVFVLEIDDIDRAARGVTYGAHLHVGPCVPGAPADAGAHYNTERLAGNANPEISKRTEVWLDFTVKRNGTAKAWTWVPFVPVAGARSIVVHEMATNPSDGMAGGRQACLPLVWAP